MLGTIDSHLEEITGEYIQSEVAPVVNCPKSLTLFQGMKYES